VARIVIAPDSFKGSLDAAAVAQGIAEGWHLERPDDEIVLLPLADGGEGTLDALAAASQGAERMPVVVTGPDDRPHRAEWLLLPSSGRRGHSLGVVELANTSGIELLGEDLRPLEAHTLGFGEAILAALDHGVDELVLGIGSSASTDGGLGVLRALGAEFLDSRGEPVGLGAAGLLSLASVDLSGLRLPPAGGVTVLSDVSAPLCGATGAAAVFGPQKGLEPNDVERVDEALRAYADLLVGALADAPRAGRGSPPPDPGRPGAGAAGGTGFGLLAWGARLVPGAGHVAAMLGLAEHCAEADLVITGEGRFDSQSLLGKVPGMVLDQAAETGRPVALIAGGIADDAPRERFFEATALAELAPSTERAIAEPEAYLREAASATARRLGTRLGGLSTR